jgi:hypothetical protein
MLEISTVKSGRGEILPLAINAVEQIITRGNRIRFSPPKHPKDRARAREDRLGYFATGSSQAPSLRDRLVHLTNSSMGSPPHTDVKGRDPSEHTDFAALRRG